MELYPWRPEYVKRAYLLALDDSPLAEIAKVLGIPNKLCMKWLIDHPEFDAAIERGWAYAEYMRIGENDYRRKQGGGYGLYEGVGALSLNPSHALFANTQVAFGFNEGSGTFMLDASGHGRHGRFASVGPATALFTSASGYINSGHIEGIAWDGTNYYVSDLTNLYKADASFTVGATKANAIADLPAVVPARNHLGDISTYNGKLYAPVEYYTGVSNSGSAIGIWNTSDLSYSGYIDVSAAYPAGNFSAIEVDAANGCFWTISFVDAIVRKLDLTTGALLASYTVPVSGYAFQSLALRNGILYIGTNPDAQSTAYIFGFDPATSRIVSQFYRNIAVDALCFNGASLLLGTSSGTVMTVVSGSVDFTTNWLASGYQFDANVWAAGFQWARPDAGSMVVGFIPATLYDFNSVWDQSPNSNDWEAWVSALGAANARVNGDNSGRRTSANSLITAGNPFQHLYTWDKAAGGTAKQYVNGAQAPAGTTTITNWVTPPAFVFLGGVQFGNTKSTLKLQYMFAFDKVLSDAEAAALAANPYGLFNRPPR